MLDYIYIFFCACMCACVHVGVKFNINVLLHLRTLPDGIFYCRKICFCLTFRFDTV